MTFFKQLFCWDKWKLHSYECTDHLQGRYWSVSAILQCVKCGNEKHIQRGQNSEFIIADPNKFGSREACIIWIRTHLHVEPEAFDEFEKLKV